MRIVDSFNNSDPKRSKVEKTNKIHVNKEAVKEQGEKKQEHHNHESKENEVAKHYEQMEKSVHKANDKLAKNKSPYRFSVYREGGEIYIDFAILDDNGNLKETINKRITHNDFLLWLEHIENGEGLFSDLKG